MTVIKPEDDPGSFTFHILNEETDLLETLTINVIEVITLLSMEGVVTDANSTKDLPLKPLVEAIRRCARPVKVVEHLEDHVLVARFASASLKMDTLGNAPRSPQNLPPPMASMPVQPGSQTTSLSPA